MGISHSRDSMGISLSRKASDFDLELLATVHRIGGCAPASDYDLESPQTVTCSSYYRETETWIREKAVAIHIPDESFVDPRLASVVSIFRVPNFLKELKNRAYVPQIVSLGPYHSEGANLSRMDDNKKRALRRMMKKFNDSHGCDSDTMEFSLRAIDKIFQERDKIRNSYEEEIDCNPECLAVMLTLDGCFILTLGGEKVKLEVSDNYEPIFERRKIDFTGFEILNDILKLENQIPLIVLRKLLEVEFNSADQAEKFLFDVLVKTPGNKFYPFDYEDIRKAYRALLDKEVPHILGLLHSLIVSPHFDDGGERANQIDSNGKGKSGKGYICIPPAVELRNAGIKFGRRNGGINKIYFDEKEDTIYLPPINITNYTEVLFRNLIALELCKPCRLNCKPCRMSEVTCYVSLMNNLIATETDVVVLRNSGIVKNYLGSDKRVAELFNDLCKGVTLPRKDVFEKLQDDVMDYCTNKVRVKAKVKVWNAQFMKDYFSSPWKILALVGAILVLLFTFVQTIYSVLAYYK